MSGAHGAGDDELGLALHHAQEEVEQLERQLRRRDAVHLDPLDALRAEAARVEETRVALEQLAAFHRHELAALEAGPGPSVTPGRALALVFLSGLVGLAGPGLVAGLEPGALFGASALAGLLVFLLGYFRG